jgi:hypothetical protein
MSWTEAAENNEDRHSLLIEWIEAEARRSCITIDASFCQHLQTGTRPEQDTVMISKVNKRGVVEGSPIGISV